MKASLLNPATKLKKAQVKEVSGRTQEVRYFVVLVSRTYHYKCNSGYDIAAASNVDEQSGFGTAVAILKQTQQALDLFAGHNSSCV